MALLDLQTFDPPVAPSYSSSRSSTNRVDSTELHNGITQVRPTGVRPLRTLNLSWILADSHTLDYIESFVDGLEGGIGPFLWQSFDLHPSPTGIKPKLEVISGGFFQTARDRYVAFTFKDQASGQETMISGESSISLEADTMYKLTLPQNINGADSKGIYVGQVSGTLYHYGYVTGRTVTEAELQATSPAISPPTSNSMRPTLRYIMGTSGVEITAKAFGLYDIRMSITESYI